MKRIPRIPNELPASGSYPEKGFRETPNGELRTVCRLSGIEPVLGECIIANAHFQTRQFWKRGLA